jgi:aspartate-semialdehyde dehydrogenase
MTEIAILGPTSLLGKELHGELGRRPHLWNRISLLAASEEEEGTVTESGGAAALVTAAEHSALASADLIFACGDIEHDLSLVRRRLEEAGGSATAILLSAGATVEHGEPVVSGVNPDTATGGGILVSPDPVAIALAYLLAPLAGEKGLGASEAAATVVLPVSALGSQGLDDLFNQARDLLAMSGERRPTLFDRQLAFSLYPVSLPTAGGPAGTAELAGLVRRAAGIRLPLAIQILQGGIFHGVSVNLYVRFADDPGEKAIRRALAGQRHVTVSPAGTSPSDVPAATDAAASEEVLVGAVRPAPEHPGAYWIWAVMDNLTRGGALNAVEVAELLQKIA